MDRPGLGLDGERATILIADDDDDIRALLEDTLRRAGHDVLVACDGEQAIRLADRCRPDIAVLDLMMPALNGYEITRRLRSHRALSGMPIILVTARTRDRDVAQGFEAGADDYLKKPFGPMELRNRVEAALAKVRRLAAAEVRAATDALTGLPNRRALEEQLDRMAAQAGRTTTPLAAVMLDLDHFKGVNDRFGHGAGDDVLAAVAEVLIETLRAGDFVGRYGGEEFLALLPDTGRQGAVIAAEKLRREIELLKAPRVERAITASLGVAVVPDDAADPASLMRAADDALYRAKGNGRNRVVAASLPPTIPFH